MVPKYQATVQLCEGLNVITVEFARFLERENVLAILNHYNELPGFKAFPYESESIEFKIFTNENYDLEDISHDLSELLNRLGITKILWKKDIIGDTVKSEDLEKILAAK